MMRFVRKLFRGNEPASIRNAREMKTAEMGTMLQRRMLAHDATTSKEILYYLAQHDPDAKVRLAVARNRNMPVQASALLAKDSNADVRMALAGRLVQLLPELSTDQQSQVYAYAVQALGTLALDEVLKIRIALSSTLKDHAHTPPKVAGQLARDVERQVSEPILRFCAALSDEDLIDIISGHKAGWALEAIAGRKTIAAAVSRALISQYDLPSGKILLANEGAEIMEDALQLIIAKARDFPEWQAPIASHKKLPPSLVRALAEFANDQVRDILLARTDFDKETAGEIAEVFHRRLDFAADQEAHAGDSPAKRVKREAKEGELDEEKISDALAMRDYDFVYASLALRLGTDAASIRRVFELKAPKPIVAICWRAGLSMRFALQLQQGLGQVQPPELIYPKGGTDYPMTREELTWQLEFLGFKG